MLAGVCSVRSARRKKRLHAVKNVDRGLGASYMVPFASLPSFTSELSVRGDYTLVVEPENRPSLIFNVHHTPEFSDATLKWNECVVAILQHRLPQ
jgi:hypothetical protein